MEEPTVYLLRSRIQASSSPIEFISFLLLSCCAAARELAEQGTEERKRGSRAFVPDETSILLTNSDSNTALS